MNFQLIVGVILVATGCYSLGYKKGKSEHQEQVVEQGYGYYDPTTREFKLGRIK